MTGVWPKATVATELVRLPYRLVITTKYDPRLLALTPGMVRMLQLVTFPATRFVGVMLVAMALKVAALVDMKNQVLVRGTSPVFVTERVTEFPGWTICDTGCKTMAGAKLTVRVAVAVP